MTIAFYIAAIIAVAATARVIMHTNAVRALLYLVISLLAVAVAFYTMGAPFAAALEVIVYAGAIMVLFVFVVMMLNINVDSIHQEQRWLESVDKLAPAVCAAVLLGVMLTMLWSGGVDKAIPADPLPPQAVGRALFGPYLLVVELASFLLLAALVVAGHVGREDVRHMDSTQQRGESDRS